MTTKRNIEIFTAGCAVCDNTIQAVNELACSSCEVTILDVHDKTVAQRAVELKIHSLPAVVVDGELASCCVGGGIDKATLQAAGVGQAVGE